MMINVASILALSLFFANAFGYDVNKYGTKIPGGTKFKASMDRSCIRGIHESGSLTVYPFWGSPTWGIEVICDGETEGGGWTIFQQRTNLPKEREDFNRSWTEYRLGFGNMGDEFWLGLDNIHALTSNALMELRIDIQGYDRVSNELKQFAKYGYFHVGSAEENYVLRVGRYSSDSTAADSLADGHNGMEFTTYDEDNDRSEDNCALKFGGGWWFNRCYFSNLNGFHNDGIKWMPFDKEYKSVQKVTMMIRPAF